MLNLKRSPIVFGLMSLIVGVVAVSCTKELPPPAQMESESNKSKKEPKCVISQNAVLGIELGMTLKKAKSQADNLQFERTYDGEGVPLVKVSESGREIMTLYAGEEDLGDSLNENAKIEMISVSDKNCKTAQGVHPGMRVKDAEGKYGKVVNILMTEIESREYVTFAEQPKWASFRLNEGSIYESGKNSTKQYE